MPLFEIASARGKEAAGLFHLRSLLAADAVFQELAEAASSAEAMTKVQVGPNPDPLDDPEQYSIEELENSFFFCTIAPPDDDGHEVTQGDSLTECPLEGGVIEVYLRRQVRRLEIEEGGRDDVYLFFLDCISALEHRIYEAAVSSATETINLKRGRRQLGPYFASYAEEAGQGVYIWAIVHFEWGDLDQGGQ